MRRVEQRVCGHVGRSRNRPRCGDAEPPELHVRKHVSDLLILSNIVACTDRGVPGRATDEPEVAVIRSDQTLLDLRAKSKLELTSTPKLSSNRARPTDSNKRVVLKNELAGCTDLA